MSIILKIKMEWKYLLSDERKTVLAFKKLKGSEPVSFKNRIEENRTLANVTNETLI